MGHEGASTRTIVVRSFGAGATGGCGHTAHQADRAASCEGWPLYENGSKDGAIRKESETIIVSQYEGVGVILHRRAGGSCVTPRLSVAYCEGHEQASNGLQMLLSAYTAFGRWRVVVVRPLVLCGPGGAARLKFRGLWSC